MEHKPRPFSTKLREGFRLADLLFLSAVPLIFIAVFQLPLETRQALAFDYSNPTVLTAFTANYVHLTGGHLLTNLLGYALVATIAYLLALLNGGRTRFYSVVTVVLLAFPVILSYLNLAAPRAGSMVGFSGLNMALLGFALVEFAIYLRQNFTDNFSVESAPVFFFLFVALAAIPYTNHLVGLAILISSLLVTLAYVLSCLPSYHATVSGFKASIRKQGYFEVLVLVPMFSLAFVTAAFPYNHAIDAGTINVYIHLIGFSLGFIVTYVWALVSITEWDRYPC